MSPEMKSTWRVIRVTATTAATVAQLHRVEWSKPSEPDSEVSEFVDAVPGELNADFIDADGAMTLDIRGEIDLSPGDNVIVTISTDGEANG